MKKTTCILFLCAIICYMVALCGCTAEPAAEEAAAMEESAAERTPEEADPADEPPETFLFPADLVTSFYLHWMPARRYDATVTSESDPELFSYLKQSFCGAYERGEAFPAREGGGIHIYFYHNEARLGHLTAYEVAVFDDTVYASDDCAYDLDVLLEKLEQYETEEHELVVNPMTGTWYRAGFYGEKAVEIP